MIFQNSILNFERKDGQTDEPKSICLFNFFKVGEWGIKIYRKCEDRIEKITVWHHKAC